MVIELCTKEWLSMIFFHTSSKIDKKIVLQTHGIGIVLILH